MQNERYHLDVDRVDKTSDRSYNVAILLRRDAEAIGEGKEVI